MKLAYFKVEEFQCACGCKKLPKPEIMQVADRIRQEWGGPIVVTSGARCNVRRNQLRSNGIPAAIGSAHNVGLAVDLAPADGRIEAFHQFCIDRLEVWGVWMECPTYTGSWAHIQLRPAGRRLFRP